MIVEERIYTFKPGAMAEFLRAYAAEGWAIHTRHLGRPLGYYTSEIGTLNQAVSLWGYADWNDRVARRAALYADPAWLAAVASISPLIQRMENRILTPAPFFAAP